MNARNSLPTDDAPGVLTEVHGQVGFVTLNRPRSLNALSLAMIRTLSQCLQVWRDDPAVKAVAIRGTNKTGPFGAFCAGGDIRFFHQTALQGHPELEDFFTEEYALNHLIHTYPKPYIAFMDGIVMGGGMGISQGARVRIVTELTRMAMPETGIGLFPDVGGGYFLSRCPGRVGEYLALTGKLVSGADAVAVGLADQLRGSTELPALWEALGTADGLMQCMMSPATESVAANADLIRLTGPINTHFSKSSVQAIVESLGHDDSDWARETLATLRQRSPLMLHVVLAQVRRARDMNLADALRMERDMVRHCFYTHHLGRSGAASETVEGIRALAVDKDHAPQWSPMRIEDVTPEMVEPFFSSPWPAHAHPLNDLS